MNIIFIPTQKIVWGIVSSDMIRSSLSCGSLSHRKSQASIVVHLFGFYVSEPFGNSLGRHRSTRKKRAVLRAWHIPNCPIIEQKNPQMIITNAHWRVYGSAFRANWNVSRVKKTRENIEWNLEIVRKSVVLAWGTQGGTPPQ